jgi:putative transposase
MPTNSRHSSIEIKELEGRGAVERSEPGGRAELDGAARGRAPGARALRQELVDEAVDRVRLGLPVGELPDELREQLADGLIDELLVGRRGDAEILGPGGLLGDLTRRLVERAMESELTEHLGYEHGAAPPGGAGNARNGAPPKTLLTDHGPVRIAAPRDRNGTFEPQIVKKNQRRLAGLDDKILALYAGGMTTREIEAYIAELYGPGVGRDTVSRVTAAVLDDAKAWQTRPLEAVYPIVYLDCLVVKIRDGQAVRNFACYLAIGVSVDGERDVLGMWYQRTEGAKFWLAVLTELKQRGVQDVLVCCVDGLAGLPEAIEAVYPQAWVQTCLVHQVRSSLRFVPYRDRKKVAADLKKIYTAVNRDHAERELEAFAERWDARYPMISASWIEHWERIVPFLAFPPDMRRAVYTTDENVKGVGWLPGGRLRGSDRSRAGRRRAADRFHGPRPSGGSDVRPGFRACGGLAGDAARSRPLGSAAVRLRRGRGRPPSEAQDLGLSPAAQLPRLRALRVAPRWRRPRPNSSPGPWPASRRPSGHRRARPARRAPSRAPARP